MNKIYKENSNYVILARLIARGAVKLCNWIEIKYLKEQKFTNKKAGSNICLRGFGLLGTETNDEELLVYIESIVEICSK